MLDVYAKEVENPRMLEPKFFSGSGSFHVILPNLNPSIAHDDTQDDTQGDTQGIDLEIVRRIKANAKVTVRELADVLDKSTPTIKRHLAKLTNIRYSGHWEVDLS